VYLVGMISGGIERGKGEGGRRRENTFLGCLVSGEKGGDFGGA